MSNYWKPCGIIPVSSIAMPFSTAVVTDLQQQKGDIIPGIEHMYDYGPEHYDTYYEQLKAEIRDWLK